MSEKSPYTLLLSFVLVSSILFNLYNNIEKIKTYMDEEFHLDQTLSYYNNQFKYWNNKLTTFPGTFLLSSVFLKLFYVFQIPINENNSIKIVRIFTIIISILSFIILGLFRKKNAELSLIYKLQLLIGFFPINFFYNFLFYTESFSIFSLILFFYLNLYTSKNILLRFLSGILCVLIRQNNIIWINLIALNEVLSLIQLFFNNKNFKNLFENILFTIGRNIDILIIDILFIIFIIYNNNSIVLGDKSHHSMVLHFAQINHLLIFSLLFFPSFNLKIIRNLNKLLKNGKKAVRFLLIFIIIISLVLICNKFSYTHDFILSDNRHYIFYYFKKIYLKDNLRYALLLYISFAYSMIINDNLKLLKDNKIISWLICTMLSLIPAELVEVRYFVPCYIIFIILVNYNKESFEDLHQYIFHWLNIFAHIIINGMTIYIFLFRSFENKFMGKEISRFMY